MRPTNQISSQPVTSALLAKRVAQRDCDVATMSRSCNAGSLREPNMITNFRENDLRWQHSVLNLLSEIFSSSFVYVSSESCLQNVLVSKSPA
jgi:hypothetical protein